MFRLITGIVAGYFIYTENGRNTLNNIGNYITNSIKNSFDELNKSITNKDKKIDSEENIQEIENARVEISLPQDERRDSRGERLCNESVELQKDDENESRGILFNSDYENERS